MEENKIKIKEKFDKDERNYGLDILRIISMMMIVVLHFNLRGGFLQNDSLTEDLKIYIISSEALCIGAVNIFVLITGYFMINQKFKLSKIIRMEIQLLMYSIIIYVLAIALNITTFNKELALYAVFPIITARYWFITSYIGLYMISPFLNMILQKLTKKQYKYLVIFLVIFGSIVISIYPNNSYIGTGNGYNLAWFIVLYIIAGYIRLHFEKKIKSIYCFAVIISIVVIQSFVKLYLANIPISLINTISKYCFSYSNIFNLLLALAFFMLFRNITIRSSFVKSIIKFITPLLLGVYLFHCHFAISIQIWKEWLKPFEHMNSYPLILVEILDILIIFTIGCGIEFCRNNLVNMILNRKRIKERIIKIENKVNSILYDA